MLQMSVAPIGNHLFASYLQIHWTSNVSLKKVKHHSRTGEYLQYSWSVCVTIVNMKNTHTQPVGTMLYYKQQNHIFLKILNALSPENF